MGKEILTEQRISDDCKKAIRRFFWRSVILIAVAPIAILIPYLIHILEPLTEEGFPPLMDICMILYVCPTLAIIIYEITKNVIVTVHLLKKGFSVAEDEVISVKHVHIRGSRPHTNYYKVNFLKHGKYLPDGDADMPDQRYFTTDELYYRIGIGERFYVILAGKRIVKAYSKKYYVLEGETEEQKEYAAGARQYRF